MRLVLLAAAVGIVTGCPKTDEPDGGPSDGGDGDADSDADSDGDADALDAGEDVPPRPDGGDGFPLGTFELALPTLAYEPNFPGTPSATLRTCKGEVIKVVTPSFAEQLTLERRGYLEDGRVVQQQGTLGGGGPCYAVLDPSVAPWGVGSYGRALEPFRSVFIEPFTAADGRWLYCPALYGLEMPGAERGLSFRHDGCLRVDDDGATGDRAAVWAVLPAYADEIERSVGRDSVELFLDSAYCPGQP